MMMTKSRKKLLVVTLALCIAIIGGFISTLITTSSAGMLFHIKQGFEIFFVLLFWLIIYQLIRVAIFHRYKEKNEREIPFIFVSMTRFILFILAGLSVIVFVFQGSIYSFVALSGLVTAGLTFALGGLILDAFAGIILEIEGPFQVGDWLKLADGTFGKVDTINWRTVILLNLEESHVIVPHSKLSQGFINYSRPDKSHWDHVEITLPQSISVDRATRILHAGLLMSPSVHDKKCTVFAFQATEEGIIYNLHYVVSDLKSFAKVKHDVIQSVMGHLQRYGMRISEEKDVAEIIWTPSKPEELIQKVSFLENLSEPLRQSIAEGMKEHSFDAGEIIVKQGDEGQSLFLIAEGIVEIKIDYVNQSGHKKDDILFTMTYPDSFGEMALLLNDKRSATVKALSNCLIYEISQSSVKMALAEKPDLFQGLVDQAVEKREKNKKRQAELEKIPADERVQKKHTFFESIRNLLN